MFKKAMWCVCVTVWLMVSPVSNAAEISAKTVQAIINSMKYVDGLQHLSAITLVYDPRIASTQQEVWQFKQKLLLLDKERHVSVTVLPISNLAELNAQTVVYIPHGMTQHAPAIYAISKEKRLFTVANDISCVKGECCILAVKGGATTDIYLNEKTLREAGFSVDTMFRFMVKRV